MKKLMFLVLAIAMMTAVLSAEWTEDEYYDYLYACRKRDLDVKLHLI
ncbi:MAG: hypothetical protein ACOX2F_02755 [bacterium]